MKYLLTSLILLTSLSLLAQKSTAAKNQTVTGNWELVTVKSIASDGNVSYPYGENPFGSMYLGKDGFYSIQIYQASRAKIESGNKRKATPEENMMLVKGSNAHYGSYTVSTQEAMISYKPEHAFFPNWEGQVLNQKYVLEGGLLTYTSGKSTFGARRSEVVWKRI